MKHHIEIQVEEQVGTVAEAPLRQAVMATLAQQRVAESCEVVVVISDDEALQSLNCRFRGLNQPTDVLSFSDDTRGPYSGGAGGFPRYLGDIVISVDRARAQADAVGATLMQELQVLVTHGMLHLLGYDHAAPEEKAEMWAAQADVLRHLGVDIPLPE
ncbi:MAG: rRNA maturation RNase YbeY [Anaerolineae bacterium]|nr:rRNA maturation RNase YbeY [Anaerolineae bacterium]